MIRDTKKKGKENDTTTIFHRSNKTISRPRYILNTSISWICIAPERWKGITMAKYLLIQAPDETEIDTNDIRKDLGGKIYIIGKFYEKIETNSLETLEQHFSKLKAREKGIDIDDIPF